MSEVSQGLFLPSLWVIIVISLQLSRFSSLFSEREVFSYPEGRQRLLRYGNGTTCHRLDTGTGGALKRTRTGGGLEWTGTEGELGRTGTGGGLEQTGTGDEKARG